MALVMNGNAQGARNTPIHPCWERNATVTTIPVPAQALFAILDQLSSYFTRIASAG